MRAKGFARAAGRMAMIFTSLCWLGCAGNDQLAALQRQVQLQGELIRRQGQQIQDLRNSMNRYPRNQPPPACDEPVMRQAMARGDEQSAQGKPQVAAGYYRDALTACPGNPQAELKLAQTDELLGNRAQALDHYGRVANGGDPALAAVARQALARLGRP
jgi:tetratricopeptide (TPR) repeat protein